MKKREIYKLFLTTTLLTACGNSDTTSTQDVTKSDTAKQSSKISSPSTQNAQQEATPTGFRDIVVDPNSPITQMVAKTSLSAQAIEERAQALTTVVNDNVLKGDIISATQARMREQFKDIQPVTQESFKQLTKVQKIQHLTRVAQFMTEAENVRAILQERELLKLNFGNLNQPDVNASWTQAAKYMAATERARTQLNASPMKELDSTEEIVKYLGFDNFLDPGRFWDDKTTSTSDEERHAADAAAQKDPINQAINDIYGSVVHYESKYTTLKSRQPIVYRNDFVAPFVTTKIQQQLKSGDQKASFINKVSTSMAKRGVLRAYNVDLTTPNTPKINQLTSSNLGPLNTSDVLTTVVKSIAAEALMHRDQWESTASLETGISPHEQTYQTTQMWVLDHFYLRGDMIKGILPSIATLDDTAYYAYHDGASNKDEPEKVLFQTRTKTGAGAPGLTLAMTEDRIEGTEQDRYVLQYLLMKNFIAGMIESGDFDGLFDYLKGRIVKVGGKDRPFFTEDEFNALTPVVGALAAGHTLSTFSARSGKKCIDASRLTLNGNHGDMLPLDLPIYMEVKGQLHTAKTTPYLSTQAAYKLHNTTLTLNHTYANVGHGFSNNSRQHETMLGINHAFGPMFVEGAIGQISASNIHRRNWNGTQYNLTFGLDTTYITPYVQATYRDLKTRTDAAGYLGVDVHISNLRTDTYTFNIHANLHLGYQQYKGHVSNLEFSGSLQLNSGIQLSTTLAFGTLSNASAGMNVTLER